MKKQIIIKVFVDSEKDEFGKIISISGFDDGKQIQTAAEIIGWLEIIKSQEILDKFFKKK